MQSTFKSKIDSSRRHRYLSSRDRVGRHSREIIWNTLRSFVRRNWILLLGVLLAPGLIAAPVAYFIMNGTERWIYVGAMGVTGPWLVVIMVVIWTGVGNTVMGLEGKSLTADVLRKLQTEGWVLVNGVKIKKDSDVDHVLIGPAGVLVLESKWSHYPWPTSDHDQTFMAGRLSGAVSQVLNNRSLIKWRFAKDLRGVTVQAVCVLWSSESTSKDPDWFSFKEAVVVRGPSLESWVTKIADNSLDSTEIDRLHKVFERQALSYDREHARHSGSPLPTVNKIIVQSIIKPFLSFTTCFTGMVIATHLHSLWIVGVSLVSLTAIGLWMRRNPTFRTMALGWLAACALFYGLVVVVTIRFFTQ